MKFKLKSLFDDKLPQGFGQLPPQSMPSSSPFISPSSQETLEGDTMKTSIILHDNFQFYGGCQALFILCSKYSNNN